MKISFETGNNDKKDNKTPQANDNAKQSDTNTPPKQTDTTSQSPDISTILKSMNAKITCIFYIFFENIPVEVGRKTIPATDKAFHYAGGKYVVQGYKPFMIKPLWYWITKNYQPILEYQLGKSLPLSLHPSDLDVDSKNLNLVTNALNIKTLLPNMNTTMQLITLIAIGGFIGSGLLAFYMIADEEGRQNIINLATNAKPKPQNQNDNNDNNGPVIITPTPPK